MSGRDRLPAGELRKASQKRTRRAAPKTIPVEIPWGLGDRLQWRDRSGMFRRHVDDQYAEVEIGERVYRIRKAELHRG